MAKVIDTRNAGGQLIILGDALVLPTSNAATFDSGLPISGSFRYNPTGDNIEYLSNSAQWVAVTGVVRSQVFTVNSQSAMLALNANKGDVAIRTDVTKTFILGAADATVLANWYELIGEAGVQSVAGLANTVITASDLRVALSIDQVNNTSDANKPTSSAVNVALATKLDVANAAVASDIWTATSTTKFVTPKAKADAENFVALTDANTVVFDMQTGTNRKITLGGNRTLANPSNAVTGMRGVIEVKQDTSGNRTLAYGSAYKFVGGAPSLSTQANAVDIIQYVVDDATIPTLACEMKNAVGGVSGAGYINGSYGVGDTNQNVITQLWPFGTRPGDLVMILPASGHPISPTSWASASFNWTLGGAYTGYQTTVYYKIVTAQDLSYLLEYDTQVGANNGYTTAAYFQTWRGPTSLAIRSGVNQASVNSLVIPAFTPAGNSAGVVGFGVAPDTIGLTTSTPGWSSPFPYFASGTATSSAIFAYSGTYSGTSLTIGGLAHTGNGQQIDGPIIGLFVELLY